MPTLSELISLAITPEAIDFHSPKFVTLSSPIEPSTEREHGKYEADVFNFLVANRGPLGIKAVMKFTALMVDGAVELIDGRRFTVEIKFQMGWLKACQAEWQFRTFMKRREKRPFPVDGGIVVFEEFSGDWARRPARRLLENGWNRWYHGHAEVDGVRLDLLCLRDGKLQGFLAEKSGG